MTRSTMLAATVALALVACTKHTEDPAEAAYGKAVAQFAALSAETKDLTYRDPRFDQVLEALDAVPSGSEASDRARALGQRIRLARAAADQDDKRSQQELQEATAAPVFVPEPSEAVAPVMPKRPGTEPEPMPHAAGSVALAVAPTAAQTGITPSLPDWYQQAGYGTPPPAPAPAPGEDSAPSDQPSDQTDVAQSPSGGNPDGSTKHHASSSDDAGWRIYGLPGPAGKALGGH
jgi:hypothetical protein